MTKIAVIAGAGPAGLTAAYELLKRSDIKPIVFEMSDAIGGIAQTYNYKGNRIDIGGHRFFSKSKRVMDWWFNVLPLQGAPAADTAEKQHEIDYAAEAVSTFLCEKCLPEGYTADQTTDDPAAAGSQSRLRFARPAPDPEKEDQVMLQRPRSSRIYYRRSFFPYPIGITLRIAMRLGLFNTFLIGLSYIKAHFFPRKDETYLEDFLINRFGRRLYNTFFRDYTEKVWGVPPKDIKAEWGAQRIKGLSLKRAVVHAVKDLLSSDFKKSQEERETSLITRFYYPKFGPGQMWETVTAQVRACGGEVHMRHSVAGVKHDGSGRVVAATVRNEETGETRDVACDFFFSTMPMRSLIAMMDPAPSPEVQRIAKGLIYRDFLTVGLLLKGLYVQEKGREPTREIPDNWIYVQEGDVRVGRVQVFNNWSPYMVADRKETQWIGLEYFVNEGDDLWSMEDSALIALGVDEMEAIRFIRREDVLDGCVLRMPKAYPAYFGTYEELKVVEEWICSFSNLFCVGRNGMHRYNNQDHSMLTAMTAVDNIVEGKTDHRNIWQVNTERVYHEERET